MLPSSLDGVASLAVLMLQGLAVLNLPHLPALILLVAFAGCSVLYPFGDYRFDGNSRTDAGGDTGGDTGAGHDGGVVACAPPRRLCDGTCTDTASDDAHCGVCETACLAGSTCLAGRCAVATPCTALDRACVPALSSCCHGECAPTGPRTVCCLPVGSTCSLGDPCCDVRGEQAACVEGRCCLGSSAACTIDGDCCTAMCRSGHCT